MAFHGRGSKSYFQSMKEKKNECMWLGFGNFIYLIDNLKVNNHDKVYFYYFDIMSPLEFSDLLRFTFPPTKQRETTLANYICRSHLPFWFYNVGCVPNLTCCTFLVRQTETIVSLPSD